jgi:competence protein ComFC
VLLSSRSNSVVEFVKEAIAPVQCVGCSVFGAWICDACRDEIVWVKEQRCYKCGQLSPAGRTCDKCRKESKLTAVAVAAHFDEGPIRLAIHALKYGGAYELAPILAGALKNVVPSEIAGSKGWVIAPVPMAKSRKRLRGYNQAELLAKEISVQLQVPLMDGLLKIRPTSPQAELSRAARLVNLRGSMTAVGSLAGARVILVDDVATTGATLEECARALREAGAKRVCGVVIARA